MLRILETNLRKGLVKILKTPVITVPMQKLLKKFYNRKVIKHKTKQNKTKEHNGGLKLRR